MSHNPLISAVVFDLDGLLIDSERVYTEATNRVLAQFGKKLDWSVKQQLQGRPAVEAMQVLIRETGIPLTVDETLRQMKVHQEELFVKVEPLPGAMKLVNHLRSHGIPIAIATGSHAANIKLKTDHLPELMGCFHNGCIITSDHLQAVGRPGKPAPDIFQMAAESLGIASDEYSKCLVFEDGMPGVEAARRGGFPCIWVPDPDLLALWNSEMTEPLPGATQTLNSLDDFVPQHFNLPPYE